MEELVLANMANVIPATVASLILAIQSTVNMIHNMPHW